MLLIQFYTSQVSINAILMEIQGHQELLMFT